MRNNEQTFQASSVTISTYANTLVSTNLIQVAIMNSKGTDIHTYSFGIKRATMSYKIKPFHDVTNHCSGKFLFCEVSVKMIKLGIHYGIN